MYNNTNSTTVQKYKYKSTSSDQYVETQDYSKQDWHQRALILKKICKNTIILTFEDLIILNRK